MRVSSRARCSEAQFSLSQGEWASASEDMLALNENMAYPEVSESCRASIPKLNPTRLPMGWALSAGRCYARWQRDFRRFP